MDRYTYLLPNPAHDEVTVFSSFHLVSVELFTLSGHLLAREYTDELSVNIDIASLPIGTYLVRITTPVGTTTKKLMKQ